MKTARLTLQRHRELGVELARVQRMLTRLLTEVGHSYLLESPAVKTTGRASKAVRDLRSALDERLCCEYPVEYGARCYYPGAPASTQENPFAAPPGPNQNDSA